MKKTALAIALAAALCGCAVSPENKQSWEIKPVVDLRHGMATSDAYYQLGRYQERQGNTTAAENYFDQALASDAKNIDAMNALGSLYAGRGDLERAAAMYKRIGELAPRRAYLYNNIGYAFVLQGRFAEAVQALRHAVILDPGYERAWLNLQEAARKGGMADVQAMAERRQLVGVGEREALANLGQPKSREEEGRSAAQPDANAMKLSENLLAQAAPMQSPPAKSGLSGAPAVAAKLESPLGLPDRSIRMREVMPQVIPDGKVLLVATPVAKTEPPVKAMRVTLASLPTQGMGKARIEVSNGNGITGFAKRFGAALTSVGARVTRITNYRSFAVPATVIEYRSGFADVAQVVKEQLGHPALLTEAKTERQGTDVQVILGRDWRMQI